MKTIDEQTQREIFNPDMELGYTFELRWASPEAYATIDNVTKFALDDSDFEDVLIYHRYTEEESLQREQEWEMVHEQERNERIMSAISQSFSETFTQSDKIGQLWRVVKLGAVEIIREYVPDPDYEQIDEDGSYLKPYHYEQGMVVEVGMWYYLDDKELPREAIASGTPTSFDDDSFLV